MTKRRYLTPRPHVSRRCAGWALAILMFCVSGYSGLSFAVEDQTAEKARSFDDRLQELERQIEALQLALASSKTRNNADGTPDLAELERRIEALSREIEKMRIGEATDDGIESVHGMGPAASKIYRKSKGVSIGGYGEMLYQSLDSRRDDGSPSGAKDQLDFLRAVLYFGYRFNDRILFNSEIEFEHASTDDDGEVSVEFAYLDFMLNEKVNARAGLLLVPMGFANELHEPPIFLGATRPELERALIPTTWRENGAGVFGDFGPVTYRAYIINGFDGAGLNHSGFDETGIRGGRQSGSKALAEDFAIAGRVDWKISPGLLLGGSFYSGNSGQGAVAETSGQTIGAHLNIVDIHAEWRWRGIEARALFVDTDLDDAELINEFQGFVGDESVGSKMRGGYVQLGYDLFARNDRTQQALIPFARYEELDSQRKVPMGFLRNPVNDEEILTLGLSYKPIPNVVVKLDFQNFDNAADTGVDRWNLALGWMF